MQEFTPVSQGQLVVNPKGQLFLNTHPTLGMAAIDIPTFVEQIALLLLDEIRRQPTDEMITAEQVAELLNCSLATVHRLTKNNSLPSTKIGHLRRYRRSEILGLRHYEKNKGPNKSR